MWLVSQIKEEPVAFQAVIQSALALVSGREQRQAEFRDWSSGNGSERAAINCCLNDFVLRAFDVTKKLPGRRLFSILS